MPHAGQIFLYSLTEEQAEAINRRRQHAVITGVGFGVQPGDAVPMIVAACASGYDDGLVAVAGRLMLDDDDNWWVTSVIEGIAPGAWREV
jgi:hypothetical protein